MRFLVDAQLPAALAYWLVSAGHQTSHVADHDLASASDTAIWNFAQAYGVVIITKDQDFSIRKTLSPVGPPVVWLRLGNTRRRELLTSFEQALPRIVEALERGEGLVEVV